MSSRRARSVSASTCAALTGGRRGRRRRGIGVVVAATTIALSLCAYDYTNATARTTRVDGSVTTKSTTTEDEDHDRRSPHHPPATDDDDNDDDDDRPFHARAGFEVARRERVPEYDASSTSYRHARTGTRVMDVRWDEDEWVFGITFRTPPTSSDGVPHVLEHSVLCGSRRYPTKDPFLLLYQTSLRTFLNAMTYPDRTVYAVASRNVKDFANLVRVYLDAVFDPLCVNDGGVILSQEGFRVDVVEEEEGGETTNGTTLVPGGIVYNEMKGVYSSPESSLYRISHHSLFPNHTYGLDAGGDPDEIPTLDYERFRDFHARYYRPSNAKIFVSGPRSGGEIGEELWGLLGEYAGRDDDDHDDDAFSRVTPFTAPFDRPRRERRPYASDDPSSSRSLATVTWALRPSSSSSPLLSPYEELVWDATERLLLGTPTSPLRRALVESGLADAVADGTGFSTGSMHATFAVGAKGLATNRTSVVEEVETLVLDTLRSLSDRGFDKEDMDAAVNTIEFRLREFDSDSKGVDFLLALNTRWNYDQPPLDGVRYEDDLAALKSEIERSGSAEFQRFIQTGLLDNPHRLTLELYPERESTTENARDAVVRAVGESAPEALRSARKSAQALRQRLDTEDPPDAVATVPTLSLADVENTETEEYPARVERLNNRTTLLTHDVPAAAGVAYVDVGVDLSAVSYDDLPLLGLFARLSEEGDKTTASAEDFQRRVGARTGGVSATISVVAVGKDDDDRVVVPDGDRLDARLVLRGKAVADRAEDLMDALRVMLTETDLDGQQRKAAEITREVRADLVSAASERGHVFAHGRARARHSVAAYLTERLSGLDHLNSTARTIENVRDDWPGVAARLRAIRDALTSPTTDVVLDLTADRATARAVRPAIDAFVRTTLGDAPVAVGRPSDVVHPWAPSARAGAAALFAKEGFVLPGAASSVSYVAKAVRTERPGAVLSGSSAVALHRLRTGLLWDEVRVAGGAYGAFGTFSEGVTTFVSYRDPRVEETLHVYDKAAAWLADGEDDDDASLESQIVGTIGDLDGGVLPPADRGRTSSSRWTRRESAGARRRWRREVLGTTAEDLRTFGREMAEAWTDDDRASVVVLSSADALDVATQQGLLDVVHAL